MGNPYEDENGVFRNKLGISNAVDLKAAEYSLTSRRMTELETGRATLNETKFGLPRLQAIHEHLFQDVYAWAGQVRTIPSSKRADNGMVSRFEQPERIASSWEALAVKTNAFAAAPGSSIEQQRDQLMSVYVEANRIHAFPEGNGRSLQTFMRQLAREQRLELDFARTTPREWNQASAVSGVHGRLFEHTHLIQQAPDTEPIRKIFAQVVRPDRALAFEKLTEAEACARFPELRPAYAGLRAIEQRARLTLGSDTERIASYMHQVREAFVKRLDEGTPPEQVRYLGRDR